MALSNRATAFAPYVERLLNDQDLHASVQRAMGAGRGAYKRAQGKSAIDVIDDKKLQRRVAEAIGAAREAWAMAGQPPPKRKPRRSGRRVLALVVVSASVFIAVNADARARILALVGHKNADTAANQ